VLGVGVGVVLLGREPAPGTGLVTQLINRVAASKEEPPVHADRAAATHTP